MRLVIAPDSFGSTLTARQAAEAIAAGWRRRSPGDELVLAPMSDGGPGFIDVLHATLGGTVLSATVQSLYGEETPATLLHVGDTVYVESAQACGSHLSERRDAEHASSIGAGQLLAAALELGVKRIVFGLGGAGTNDAGAGLLAALGAHSDPANALVTGPAALADLRSADVRRARERLGGVDLTVATDVDLPLLGLRGTTNAFGTDRGIPEDRLQTVDAQLERLADTTDRVLADARGAGAGGGMGFALLLLGGTGTDAISVVTSCVGLASLARGADLVITGEGSFDFASRSGKVPYGVAAVAAEAVRPCIALAGQVLVGSREMRALGVESAYSMVDLVGRERALAEPAASLSALAERVARSWSR
jgi:glycerate kinase